MYVREYLQDPCGKLSVPRWKAVSMVMPGDVKIVHCSEWNGQYEDFKRFFRLRHDLRDLSPLDFDYDPYVTMFWLITPSTDRFSRTSHKVSPGRSAGASVCLTITERSFIIGSGFSREE